MVTVPKFMNSMITDLQSDAWGRGVKLVLDASTKITATQTAQELTSCIQPLIAALIRKAPIGSALSVMTSFDAKGKLNTGIWSIQISSDAFDITPLSADIEKVREGLAKLNGSLNMNLTTEAFSIQLSLPNGSQQPPNTTKKTAVVVDDDVDTQEFLSTVLENNGFNVISVNDGFDALVVIERHNPDVVLTDILMPNMNGLDLVSRIKSFRSDLPVIVFSGYRDALVKNFAGLPDKILPKPMSYDQVVAAVNDVLRS
jgi:CheY-like chemotaxis protein